MQRDRPRVRIRRVACSIAVRTWAWVPLSRSAPNDKSQARTASAWERCGSCNVPIRDSPWLAAQGQGLVVPAGGRAAGSCPLGLAAGSALDIVSGASAGSCPGDRASRSPWLPRFRVSRRARGRAQCPVRPRSDEGGAAAAVAGRRAGGAGSRSLRSATPPHAGTAAATWPPA